jgi:hypothetical protein
MVGGTVVGLSRKNGETLLNVEDTRRPGDVCAVRCEERRTDTNEPIQVMPGDQVWWQCGKVYWTPKRGKAPVCRYRDHDAVTEGDDIPLRKIGYSH